MQGNEKQSSGKSFVKVFNRKHERVRGLWIRGGVYYAQVWLHDSAKQVPLNGTKTIPDAIAAQQELKRKIKAGEYPPKQATVVDSANHSRRRKASSGAWKMRFGILAGYREQNIDNLRAAVTRADWWI